MPLDLPDGPVTEARPLEHRGSLPAEADVVVIGGGVAGVMTAWFCRKAGQRVVLVEKGRVAGEQSSRNWGWIRQQGRDPAELPIVMEAQRIWTAMQAETNEDLGLRQTGTAYLIRNRADLNRYEKWMPFAHEHGLDSRMLTQKETADLLPGAATTWHGALWTASDMRAEPWIAVPALARAAVREGVVIREGCAARRLDIEAGRVAGVVTELGRIRAPRVVLAGGAWSSLFLRAHGIAIPQLSVRSTVVATQALPEVFDGCAADDRIAFRRRADGGYSLAPSNYHDFYIGPDAFRAFRSFVPQLRSDPFGSAYRPAAPAGYPDAWRTRRNWTGDEVTPFERMRVLNPPPHAGKAQEAAKLFGAAFPQLGEVRVRAAWAGMIDTMPDTVPVIDRADSLPGLVILTGLSGHGFGIGPGVGRVAADLAMDRAPGHDLSRFRLSRFSDGSKIDLGPHL
ncbi:FAD-binding oxidoreductase [Mesobaculum littorinae]|uniref:FAD-binding oxidoreductase n=1 Tax=Mesobaculum littorinae TaxID=2486419 RepID=A0A438AE52_9RHOB|nr:FAD-binding oxidoreductase [Mesobaculum littorinae]RVV96938.1 FAD-binding oxidoreductase [Mesobaculum littorinae]